MRRRERSIAPIPLPTLDLPHIQPRLTMLGAEDCQRIHQASCTILERTGVRVYHEGGLSLLRQAGAKIDGDWARIPAA